MMDEIVFVGSGIATTVVAQVIINGGGGDAWTGLLPLFNYCGLMLVPVIGGSGGRKRRHKDSDAESSTPSPPLAASVVAAAHHKRRHAVTRPGADVEQQHHADEDEHGHHQHANNGEHVRCAVSARTSVALTVLLDIIGFLLSVGGLAFAGSGAHQVLYSSVVCFAALFSWALRGRRLTAQQAAGVVVVMAGLALSASGWSLSTRGGPGAARLASNPLDHRVLAGMAMSVASALVYGLVYVLAEAATAAPDYPGPKALAFRVGAGIVCVCLVYIAAVVPPRVGEIRGRIAAVGQLTLPQVAALYVAVSVFSALHSLSYFRLVATSGATATGIFSALRAVGVFAASHPLFCAQQASQCFTASRGLSSAVVIAGVLLFSWKRSSR